MSQAPAQEKSRTPQHGSFQNFQSNHNLSFKQAQQDFLDAMAAAGIAPADPNVIIADGVLHRYRVEGDKPNTKNGYYTLHLDSVPSGAFGSWKVGINQTWCAKTRNEMTPALRDEQRRRIEAARRAAADLRAQQNQSAAERAAYIWDRAKPAQSDHAYLVRKGIQPGIARQKDDVLVLPIQSFSGDLKSLQSIGEDGSKRLMKNGAKAGNFILVQSPENPTRTLIVEGWATAQTVAEIEPQSRVIAAIDCYNLEAVVVGARKQWPDDEIVVACDNDRATHGNPGVTKGRAAAIAAGAKMLIPQFPDDAPLELSDFNDLMLWRAKA